MICTNMYHSNTCRVSAAVEIEKFRTGINSDSVDETTKRKYIEEEERRFNSIRVWLSSDDCTSHCKLFRTNVTVYLVPVVAISTRSPLNRRTGHRRGHRQHGRRPHPTCCRWMHTTRLPPVHQHSRPPMIGSIRRQPHRHRPPPPVGLC
jgi:hypothetical protein